MPQFRIHLIDGDEEIVTASRATVDGPVTVFESPSGGSTWKVVRQVPTAEIKTVQRRVIESGGMARWITDRPRPVNTSRVWS